MLPRITSHATCANAFARQDRPSGKASNIYFDGDTIFSYGRHFAIAKLVKTPNGATVALFTTRDYSISTSKHKSRVHMALYRAGIRTFTVPNLDLNGSLQTHVANWSDLIARADECERKAKRARVYRESYIESAAKLRAEAGDYWRTFRPSDVETSSAA